MADSPCGLRAKVSTRRANGHVCICRALDSGPTRRARRGHQLQGARASWPRSGSEGQIVSSRGSGLVQREVVACARSTATPAESRTANEGGRSSVMCRARDRGNTTGQRPGHQVDGVQRDRRAPRLWPAVHKPHQPGAALIRGQLGQAASARARLGRLNSEPSHASKNHAGHPIRGRVPSCTSAWSHQHEARAPLLPRRRRPRCPPFFMPSQSIQHER